MSFNFSLVKSISLLLTFFLYFLFRHAVKYLYFYFLGGLYCLFKRINSFVLHIDLW